MTVFGKVVVGLDGSEAARLALLWAADRTDELHVVHSGAPDPVVPADISVTSIHSRDEPPADALMHAASELAADAIIVGPHGSGLGRGLGSTTRHLLHYAHLPVLVVDGDGPEHQVAPEAPVVACVGYGDPAKAAVEWAAAFAIDRERPLVLLHAVAYRPVFPVDSASDMIASYLGTGVSVDWARSELAEMAKELSEAHPDLAITTSVDSTSVLKAVTRAGEHAELVVLGKRTGDSFKDSLGTPRLRRLVARSRFPTAVIPAVTPA